MKFDPSPTAIWKKYERDRDYKRSIGLYDRVRRNEAFYLGAVSLLQKEGFRTLSARFQDDLYVLPASIHELMLLPKQMISLANVRALLRKANQEAIKPEEWLSDQVYLYERSSDAVRLAEMEN